MKKNDFAIFIVYVAMFALALCVGIFAIRPMVMQYSTSLPINFIALVILSLIAGVLLNGIILELGHLLGAKVGGYEVLSCVIFLIGVKKKDGKKRFGFHSYDGLTGETKIAPKDLEKSTLGSYIFFPVLFYLVELIVLIIINSIAQARINDGALSYAWLQIFSVTILAVGGMIFLYDIFPFHLDSMNDGYLFALLSHPGNKLAYNHLLIQNKIRDEGGVPPEMPVFDDITDFTASLNSLTAYRLLVEGKFDEASIVLDKTVHAEHGVSLAARHEAACVKLALLLASDKTSVGKAFYEEFDDARRKYISEMSTVAALRCYLLVSAVMEESEAECNYAIDKADKVLKNTDPVLLESEKALLQHDKDFVAKMHPTYDLYPLPWEEKKAE